jgi:DNA-binding IscR family transcriptional regulator
VEFTWKLLKSDVIERLGKMKNGVDPMAQLVQKVSTKIDAPLEIVEREMGRLVRTGLLKSQPTKEGLIWQWS